MNKEPLFDVVIFNYETGLISNIVGKDLPDNDTSHYNVNRRIETALMRCNDRYGATSVPAGQCKVGDKIPAKE